MAKFLDKTDLQIYTSTAASSLKMVGNTCFYDSFVANQKLVFQMNFSANIPLLRLNDFRFHSFI